MLGQPVHTTSSIDAWHSMQLPTRLDAGKRAIKSWFLSISLNSFTTLVQLLMIGKRKKNSQAAFPVFVPKIVVWQASVCPSKPMPLIFISTSLVPSISATSLLNMHSKA
jgi:hypothetical protein